MSEMVERIARLMSVIHCDGDDTAWADDYGPFDAYKEAYRKDARAVIEAMREFKMVVRQDGEVVHELRGPPDDIWKAMIDAALSKA